MTLRDDTLWDSLRFLRTKLTVASLALALLERQEHDAATRARAQTYLRDALAEMTREIADLEQRSLSGMRTSAVREDRLIATQVGTPRREDLDSVVGATAPTDAATRYAAVRDQEQVLANQRERLASAAASDGRGESRHSPR